MITIIIIILRIAEFTALTCFGACCVQLLNLPIFLKTGEFYVFEKDIPNIPSDKQIVCTFIKVEEPEMYNLHYKYYFYSYEQNKMFTFYERTRFPKLISSEIFMNYPHCGAYSLKPLNSFYLLDFIKEKLSKIFDI